MEVLYLTYDGLLDPLGQSQILPYLSGLHRESGVSFHILSFEKQDRWRKMGHQLRAKLRKEGMAWTPLSFTRRPPFLAKAYDTLRFYRAARQIVLQKQIAFLHARSYVAGWIAHRLSNRYRLPWIFDMRGFWADEKRETGAWPAHNPFFNALYRLWKRREAQMLSSASAIVVLTEAAKETLQGWGLSPSQVSVIPCTADYSHFYLPEEAYPAVRKAIRERLHIPLSAFVLGYVGSIGPLYELDEMLHFFSQLQKVEPNSFMVFYTPASPEKIRSAASAKGIPSENLRIQLLSREELPQYLTALDASIIFCKPGFSRKGSSPTRIAELLAMNIPVVAQADLGDNLRLAQMIEGLYLCPQTTPEAYAPIIQTLLETHQRRGREGSPRSSSQPLLSLEVGLSRYLQVYAALSSLRFPGRPLPLTHEGNHQAQEKSN
ncbi:MAG: glycosyltransferase [Bacteroidia bacterium]|nr:glycosyltransferase [Bacteroidia bacterium]